jgi:CheY-like chemotaxis protein
MTRILLVEDNEMNRDMLQRRLERRGFVVSIAVDGAESIEKARSSAPDLILMDMGLPVMDGYQATRILKEDPATRRIPVLGLSAHAMTGDAAKAMAAGCDDYDTKPVELKRLLAKIQALLERPRRGGAAADTPPFETAAAALSGASLERGSGGGVAPARQSHSPPPLPRLPPLPPGPHRGASETEVGSAVERTRHEHDPDTVRIRPTTIAAAAIAPSKIARDKIERETLAREAGTPARERTSLGVERAFGVERAPEREADRGQHPKPDELPDEPVLPRRS